MHRQTSGISLVTPQPNIGTRLTQGSAMSAFERLVPPEPPRANEIQISLLLLLFVQLWSCVFHICGDCHQDPRHASPHLLKWRISAWAFSPHIRELSSSTLMVWPQHDPYNVTLEIRTFNHRSQLKQAQGTDHRDQVLEHLKFSRGTSHISNSSGFRYCGDAICNSHVMESI